MIQSEYLFGVEKILTNILKNQVGPSMWVSSARRNYGYVSHKYNHDLVYLIRLRSNLHFELQLFNYRYPSRPVQINKIYYDPN